MANKQATVITVDGKKHTSVLPVTAHRTNSGAKMRRGVLPVAYWVNGDGTGRTFYGVTREHAFQRALRWGKTNAFGAGQ